MSTDSPQGQSRPSTAASTASPKTTETTPLRIIVEVHDGLVSDVSGIPPGVEVEIRDYDCTDESEDADPEAEYSSSIYGHQPEPPAAK